MPALCCRLFAESWLWSEHRCNGITEFVEFINIIIYIYIYIVRNNNWQKNGQSHIGSGCAPLALAAITVKLFHIVTGEFRIYQNMGVARSAKATPIIFVMVEGWE